MNAIVAPESAAIRFAGAMNYRIEGDVAHLEADLQVVDPARAAHSGWCLQFWTDAGGPEILIAELPLGGVAGAQGAVIPVGGSAPAALPAGDRAHRVGFRLACAAPAGEEQHDYAQFSHEQHFCLPRLAGTVGYRFADGGVELSVDAVDNPRDEGNLSGTLALELWALPFAYQGGAFEGVPVAGIQIGSLAGQGSMSGLRFALPAASLPPGEWHITLMLREWTTGGFVTRDFSRFAHTYRVESPVPRVRKEPAPVAQRAANDGRVAVNSASVGELVAVKGVSKALAAAIAGGRPYQSLDDLTRVRGIGEKLLGKLRSQLRL